jgi:hypothetical protein
VLDGVGVIRACLFEEPLEVIRGRSCLALASTHGLYGVHHTGAVCLLIDVAIIVDGGLLVALPAPLLGGFGALLTTMDGNVTPSFYGAFAGIGHRMERS